MKRFLFIFSALMLFSTQALAGGFMIGEMGTRATGMGSAFTAVADDASATWYNPAGVAFIEGTNVMLGGDVLFVPGTDFTSNTSNPFGAGITSSVNSDTFFVPHAYLTYTDADYKLSASLGVNAPFGLETDWPTTTPFSALTTFSRLEMINTNFNITYKVSDNFAIAGGVDYTSAQNVDLNSIFQTIGADGDGFGWNAAVIYKGDQFSAGVSYRSEIDVDLSGSATLDLGAITGTAPPGAFVQSGPATTTMTLPSIANFGVAWTPNDEWILSVDVDWVGWSSIDQLNLAFGGALGGSLPSAPVAFNWDDTITFRVGTEWKYASNMRARLGYVFDETPITDPDFTSAIPGNDRHIFSVGYSYDFNTQTTMDLAYAYVLLDNRNQTAGVGLNALKNGVYESDVHILAASLAHHF